MWSIEDTIISLTCDKVAKWKLASYVKLDKPYNRYKREEFAEIISKESEINYELLSLLKHCREQKTAYKELVDLYMKDHNTLPPNIRKNTSESYDWVLILKEYKS